MTIWDFSAFDDDTLKEMDKHISALDRLGFPVVSDDAVSELRNEIKSRKAGKLEKVT